VLNLFEIKPGQLVRLASGAVCEVIQNIGDGIWLELRTLTHPDDASRAGTEELVHCEEMVGLAESVQA